MKAALLALVLVLPTAAALDAFPDESHLGAREARFLLRLPDGGTLRLRSDANVSVAVVAPGTTPDAFEDAPAQFAVTTRTSWHGLPGAVELVVHRVDPAQNVTLEADDGAGGAVLEWPASHEASSRWVPAPGLALVGIACVAATLRAGRRGK